MRIISQALLMVWSAASLHSEVFAPIHEKRLQKLETHITEAVEAYPDVPQSVVKRIIVEESGGQPNAIGRLGEIGLMQLMPATRDFVSRNILKLPQGRIINAFDPRENILAGTALLDWLLKRYEGDWTFAFLAYNCGHGYADKLYGKSISQVARRTPQVTRKYLMAVKSSLPYEAQQSVLTLNAAWSAKPEAKATTRMAVTTPRATTAHDGTIVLKLRKGETVSLVVSHVTGSVHDWKKDNVQVVLPDGTVSAKTAFAMARLPIGTSVILATQTKGPLLASVGTPSSTASDPGPRQNLASASAMPYHTADANPLFFLLLAVPRHISRLRRRSR